MNKIEVIGLGAGDLAQLPLGIYKKLKQTNRTIFARTEQHPVIKELQKEGIVFHSFDEFYEKATDFTTVYKNIVNHLMKVATEESLIYVVPGHPMIAEKTVQLLLEETTLRIDVIGGQSFLDDLFTALRVDPIEGFQFYDATSFSNEQIDYTTPTVFCQVYDRFVASHLKISLLEDLPPEYEIVVIDAVGSKKETIEKLTLEQLDRDGSFTNLTTVYVPPAPSSLLRHKFTTLRETIRTLRGPDGCEWDRKQTHESLRPYAIEEVYELIDAINRQDDEGIVEELGDVLLQVMLHSQIGEDVGYFTIDDVILRITEKMIHRHPHVFNKTLPYKSWEQLKREEKGKQAEERESFLSGVITEGPALHVAEQMQKQAAKVGFDWEDVAEVWEKFSEEREEFAEAVQKKDQDGMEEEFGDLLFVMANLARFYNLHPELALHRANQKFTYRFQQMEQLARKKNMEFTKLTLKELDSLWNQVKEKENG